MATIDADAHVIENDQTWSYLEGENTKYRPNKLLQVTDLPQLNDGGRHAREFWLFDKNFQRADINVNRRDIEEGSRELTSVEERLKHMDALNVDVQILYPTMFLNPCFDDPMAEFALYHSYNEWLADIWKQAPDRLYWAAAIAPYSMHRVREELEFCKANGAVSVFLRPFECERLPFDSYFFPLYEAAQDLDLAITFHSGNGSFNNRRFFHPHNFAVFKTCLLNCFHGLLEFEMPKRFPGLRWGIIEGSASWIPWALIDLDKRFKRLGKRFDSDPLKTNNIYVTLEMSDDIQYVIDRVGDDNLVIGTDYGHTDTSSDIEALRSLRDSGTIDAQSATKILGPNAERLYGLAGN
jgi:predicted TIM-barrel fold metal-dependent hydrolase